MNFRKTLLPLLLAPAIFVPGASAQTYRYGHATTLMPDGNILITGGRGPANAVTNSVEMYSMKANNYTDMVWGTLQNARSSHTATLMSSGKVLIAGGFNNGGTPMTSLEICNPITATCANASANLATARGGHTATLLTNGANAGKVMVCGGQSAASSMTVTETCEFVTPGTGNNVTVAAAASMVSSRMGHTASLLRGGRVFISGGMRYNGGWIYEPMNEMYDPETAAWTPVSSLLQGRVSHTATVLNNGLVMIAGGFNGGAAATGQNVNYCQAEDPESLEDECWHIRTGADITQNTGTHGFIDGAEFFDPNGARVTIQENTYGEIPYRVMAHSAVLEQDGRWRMHGGYGGIVPTFFMDSPSLESTSVFYLTQVPGSTNTATVNNTSVVEFPLSFSLSRPVSGRLVDADLYISPPADPDSPSIEMDSVQIVLPASRAAADGKAVGLLLGEEDYEPGDFDSIVRLVVNGGNAEFSETSVTSGEETNTTIITSSLTIAGGSLDPGETAGVSGEFTANVAFKLPDIFDGAIRGAIRMTSGQVEDLDDGFYSLTFDGGGTASFYIAAPSSCDTEELTCSFTAQLVFSNVTGTLANMTEVGNGTTFFSDVGEGLVAGDRISMAMDVNFIAERITIGDKEPAYSFDQSTAVVREMIFSSELAYYPDTNAWADLTDKDESPSLSLPAFNHTALYTPADDTLIYGGRNCEDTPATDCLRANKSFLPAAGRTVFIPVYASAEGSTSWPESEKLTSKRAFHTSTVLPDGRILTCGGSDGAKPLTTCELMDPATKKWSATGSMHMARANHTATLLPNGNVLAAGGVSPAGVAISSAEVFYPDTQRWVVTSPMSERRQLHTATLMPDGNVLVAGGATTSTYSATAEIYISSAAYWLAGGNLQEHRSQHTATLLKNGNVLLAGGINGFGPMTESEIYNYATRTSAAVGDPLDTARYDHTATLLRDGNVVVIGGSNGVDALSSAEVFDGANWGTVAALNWNRSNHQALLLPNGKIMVTGGEMRGTAQSIPESFDPDFRSFAEQGTSVGRTRHTSVLTRDNNILNIGGWDGGAYLDTTEMVPFSFSPDMHGLAAETPRQPIVSTCTPQFNRGDYATLLSNTSNFHGITEASGGGAGSANSSFHNPRVYMRQMDNDSGFLVDLSTYIYSAYSGPNTSWDRTLSSITIITPTMAGAMPHGWYEMRVAAAGIFSDGVPVQVTVPRPTGVASTPTGTVLGTSSITWTWSRNTIPVNGADGYSVYSATDNVFITTITFSDNVSYTQAGLTPNTAASIMVKPYNLGGSGDLAKSATYYTLATVPEPLTINEASFETALLEWARNGNSDLTTFEVSMSPAKSPKFSDPLSISTPVPFSVNYMSTSTLITSLSANQLYDFRVRAMNGAGLVTVFTSYASTITVSGVNNFTGQALSSSTIDWSWDESVGADYYELYDVTAGTSSAVMVGSTTTNSYSQTGLSANRLYYAVVSAVNDTSGFGPIRGPLTYPVGVYTLTVQPLPGVPNVFTNVSTGTITANWITNGNSTWTVYNIAISTNEETAVSSTTTTEASSTFNKLSPNVEYSFYLTPRNGDGVEGTTLELGSKYTLAKVPAILTADEISMSGISLSWDPDGNSDTTVYELRSSTSEAFANPIVTHIQFAEGYTDTYAFINGLLTGTSYYFDVAARNGENVVTARKRALAAFTLAGPSGAPAGSVGGTSDPSELTVISGTLPDNRDVSMTIPPGAFAAATAIAISSSATNSCSYLFGSKPVEVAIYSENSSQPQQPVTLTLKFDDEPTATRDAIINNASTVVLTRYNPVSGQCLPLETTVNVGERTITATLNHFSVFQLMVRSAATDLANIVTYPNPFYPNRGQGFVTIDRIPASSKVRIYTLSGDKVWEASAGSTGVVIWRGINKSGNLVASGVYLAVIDSSAGKKIVKIAVER